MKRPCLRRDAFSVASALCLVSAFRLTAQTTPAVEPNPSAGSTDDEPVVLSPFTVDAAREDQGYRATHTLAGTRIRTELKDVGSAISVVTTKFLQDTNSKSAQDLLVYTTGTEVAGQGGNFLGQGDGAVLTDTNRQAPTTNTRVRGLAEADNTRDFYLSDIPWDAYNVGRVDLQRGPNSILFGIGSPAGIVNASLNAASFQDSGLTFAESRAHFSFWCILAAPLMAGNDVRSMSPEIRAVLTDKDAIAINQDPLGKQGFRALAEPSRRIEVWARELSNQEWAICVLNTGPAAADLTVEWHRLHFLHGTYAVREVWSKQSIGDTQKPYTRSVDSHDVMLFRLTPQK